MCLGQVTSGWAKSLFQNYVQGLRVIELAKNSSYEYPWVLAAVAGLGKIYAGRFIDGFEARNLCAWASRERAGEAYILQRRRFTCFSES